MSLPAPTPTQLVFPPLLAILHQGCVVDLGAPWGKPTWRTLPTPTGFLFVPWLVSNPRVSFWKAAECDAVSTERASECCVFNTASLYSNLGQSLFLRACDPQQSGVCGHGHPIHVNSGLGLVVSDQLQGLQGQ